MGFLYSRNLCSQEEARIAAQEEKMGSEDQALMVHSNKTRISSHHPRGKHSHKDICLESDVIHVTRKDTMLENVLETKMSLTRRRETREEIMLML